MADWLYGSNCRDTVMDKSGGNLALAPKIISFWEENCSVKAGVKAMGYEAVCCTWDRRLLGKPWKAL